MQNPVITVVNEINNLTMIADLSTVLYVKKVKEFKF
jgi:hypothetical protein